jgi:hypothetical protein
MDLNKEQEEIWALVKKINESWYKWETSRLTDYFHLQIVFNCPDFKHQIVGKDNCIQTCIDFMNIQNPNIHLFANTATIAYDLK